MGKYTHTQTPFATLERETSRGISRGGIERFSRVTSAKIGRPSSSRAVRRGRAMTWSEFLDVQGHGVTSRRDLF